jgi:hypothetical protein
MLLQSNMTTPLADDDPAITSQSIYYFLIGSEPSLYCKFNYFSIWLKIGIIRGGFQIQFEGLPFGLAFNVYPKSY